MSIDDIEPGILLFVSSAADNVDWYTDMVLSLEFVWMVGLGWLQVGLGAVGIVVAGLSWMPEGKAASFHFTTGKVVDGDVVQATRNTVVLQSGGRILPTSLNQIERVVLPLADGSELTGELVSWKDGVFEIRSADLLMRVKDGEILEDESEVAASPPETRPARRPEPTRAEASLSMAMKGLPALTLKDGKVLVGQIIQATGSVVTIHQYRGGIVPTSRMQIESVQFVGDDGSVVDGRFDSWSDSVYQLTVGDQEILASLSDRAAAAGPPSALQAKLAEDAQSLAAEMAEGSVIDSADAAITPDTGDDGANPSKAVQEPKSETQAPAPVQAEVPAVNDTDVNDVPGAGGPVSETAASLEALAGDAPVAVNGDVPHLVESIVKDVGEGGEAVVFEFHLVPPATRPLVILYAATDDTALAGQDFEAKSGVITFSAGSEYAEVRVPLIDDEQSESVEHFHLFLSGDPQTIQFSQRQIQATINDDD